MAGVIPLTDPQHPNFKLRLLEAQKVREAQAMAEKIAAQSKIPERQTKTDK